VIREHDTPLQGNENTVKRDVRLDNPLGSIGSKGFTNAARLRHKKIARGVRVVVPRLHVPTGMDPLRCGRTEGTRRGSCEEEGGRCGPQRRDRRPAPAPPPTRPSGWGCGGCAGLGTRFRIAKKPPIIIHNNNRI